jgi:hypothetical protein
VPLHQRQAGPAGEIGDARELVVDGGRVAGLHRGVDPPLRPPERGQRLPRGSGVLDREQSQAGRLGGVDGGRARLHAGAHGVGHRARVGAALGELQRLDGQRRCGAQPAGLGER